LTLVICGTVVPPGAAQLAKTSEAATIVVPVFVIFIGRVPYR
jgi:hypothetical protein